MVGDRGVRPPIYDCLDEGDGECLEDIEYLRFQMNQAYKKGLELTNGEMIEMSQDLDKLLLKYQRECTTNETSSSTASILLSSLTFLEFLSAFPIIIFTSSSKP
ncbi:aspartyl-phosphate phosphatase Spo0E family protein [Paenibacillus sp. SC116]|uniref:aspartyl-phosphate phosphatase Spo0E family protein n=1 Tax=Paenibacillus sp. SC116 TaxID=2968986 RepID=UPI00215A83BE|nr:aspartyl-phosphate phosphatase Spo0E family protein [Paenibacillus sp. SC116]MCR8844135.1 aspartyl-phosphate phosphatase Spo0E family protein [Paenibacillus sp. SC116]